MQIQYCAAVPSQGQAKPALELRSIDSSELTDIAPDATQRAVLYRTASGLPSVKSQVSTWELPSAVWARMAGATPGALIVLVSAEDLAAARAAHDA